MAPPSAEFTAELLEAAVRQAAKAVAVLCPAVVEDQGVTLTARWGDQLDVRHITEAGDDEDETELSAEQVAGYVAKYATKATEPGRHPRSPHPRGGSGRPGPARARS